RVLHVQCVLLAIKILMNVRKVLSFSPNERRLPTGYIVLVNHGMSEFFLRNNHKTILQMLDEHRLVRLILILRHVRSEEHTSELQSRFELVCRLLLEKKKYERYLIYTTRQILV